MPTHATVFSQLTALLYQSEFQRCADAFPMPRTSRSFSAYDHFLALCFGQLTFRESLRDIIACLQARPQLQYHLGFRGKITRTNLAYANEKRDWRVFAGIAEVLIRRLTNSTGTNQTIQIYLSWPLHWTVRSFI